MRLTTDKSIAVSPPMKRVSSLVRFAALNKACSFAESIIEKYSSFSEEYKSFDAFVFLRNFNESLEQEEKQQDEMMLAVRLIISRQLVITGRISLPGAGKTYPSAIERRISEIITKLRVTDYYNWKLLKELQKTIENEEVFSRFISRNDISFETHKETASSVDLGGLFSLIYLTLSEEKTTEYSKSFSLPERSLVFRRDKLDIIVPEITTRPDNIDIAENASRADMSGAEYPVSDDLVLRTKSTDTPTDALTQKEPAGDRPTFQSTETRTITEIHPALNTPADSTIHNRNHTAKTSEGTINVSHPGINNTVPPASISEDNASVLSPDGQTDTNILNVPLTSAEYPVSGDFILRAENKDTPTAADKQKEEARDISSFQSTEIRTITEIHPALNTPADSTIDYKNNTAITTEGSTNVSRPGANNTVPPASIPGDNVSAITPDRQTDTNILNVLPVSGEYPVSGDFILRTDNKDTPTAAETKKETAADKLPVQSTETRTITEIHPALNTPADSKIDYKNNTAKTSEGITNVSRPGANNTVPPASISEDNTSVLSPDGQTDTNILNVIPVSGEYPVSGDFILRTDNKDTPTAAETKKETAADKLTVQSTETRTITEIHPALNTPADSKIDYKNNTAITTEGSTNVSRPGANNTIPPAPIPGDNVSAITPDRQTDTNILNVIPVSGEYPVSGDFILRTDNRDIPTSAETKKETAADKLTVQSTETRTITEIHPALNTPADSKIDYKNNTAITTEGITNVSRPGANNTVPPASIPGDNVSAITPDRQTDTNILNVLPVSGEYPGSEDLVLRTDGTVVPSDTEKPVEKIISGDARSEETIPDNAHARSATVSSIPSQDGKEKGKAVSSQPDAEPMICISHMSRGAGYFSRIISRLSGRERLRMTLFSETINGLRKYPSGTLFRALACLNAPSLADGAARGIIRESAEMILRQPVEAEDLPLMTDHKLSFIQKTELLSLTLRKLRDREHSTIYKEHPILKIYEDRAIRMLASGSAGMMDHLTANDDPFSEKLALYYASSRNTAAIPSAEENIRINKTISRYGYSGYRLIMPSYPDTILLKREKTPAVSDRQEDMPLKKTDISSGMQGISGYVFRNIKDFSDNSDDSKHITAEGSVGSVSFPDYHSYNETAASLSLLQRPLADTAAPVRNSSLSGNAAAPSSDALIRQYGNLIEGADPSGINMTVSSSIGENEIVKGLREISERLDRTATQAEENKGMLEKLDKRQSEIESVTLKSSDLRQISDEVIGRLRTQLRLDRSRYSKG